jgi:hypothetical protein
MDKYMALISLSLLIKPVEVIKNPLSEPKIKMDDG